jgi:hypothetical protein
MLAGSAIDLHEIVMPEILDPRQVKGLHSGLCPRNVLGMLAGFVDGDHRPPPLGSSRLDRRKRPFYPLPISGSPLIGRCLRLGTGQRV